MRGRQIISTFIILALLLPILAQSDSSDAGTVYGSLQLDMVCPTSSEGFRIVNNSSAPADLRDYTVTDGEGTITFKQPIELATGCGINIFVSEPEPWMDIGEYALIGTNGISSSGRFSLADSGDDIYLKKGDAVIDSFAWGSVYTNGWNGNGLVKISKCTMALRNHAYGNEGETDQWRTYVPGMTLYHFPRTFDGCSVTPFSFPESDGSEIIAALQDARSSVKISIYTISHPSVASVLAHLLGKGVEVRILVEGSPAGGISSEEIQILAALQKRGADIHLIKSAESYKRYSYVHSKYAVIDGCRSVITSENWTESSFSSNRGWGAVIDSSECARYLELFFDSDFSSDRKDIIGFRSAYPTATPYRIGKFTPVASSFRSYSASVTPVIAPDYSWKTLMSFISSAKERLYSQQLYVEYAWTERADNPLSAMEEIGRSGTDCRLLVDVTYDSPVDDDYRDGYGVCTAYDGNSSLRVKYEDSRAFSMAHNKGIVCDGRVWIGSMNWTENSIRYNREISVIIDSEEIADMFAELFLSDWGIEFSGEVSIKIDVPHAEPGITAVLDATSSSVPAGSAFEWDLDGDGLPERTGRTASWRFYSDTECVLTVTDPDGNVYTETFTVCLAEQPSDDGKDLLDGPLKYVPLAAFCAIIIVMKRLRKPGRT